MSVTAVFIDTCQTQVVSKLMFDEVEFLTTYFLKQQLTSSWQFTTCSFLNSDLFMTLSKHSFGFIRRFFKQMTFSRYYAITTRPLSIGLPF